MAELVGATSISTKDTEYLKTFFTKPLKIKKAKDPRQRILEEWIKYWKIEPIPVAGGCLFGLVLIFFSGSITEDDVIAYAGAALILYIVGVCIYININRPQWKAVREGAS